MCSATFAGRNWPIRLLFLQNVVSKPLVLCSKDLSHFLLDYNYKDECSLTEFWKAVSYHKISQSQKGEKIIWKINWGLFIIYAHRKWPTSFMFMCKSPVSMFTMCDHSFFSWMLQNTAKSGSKCRTKSWYMGIPRYIWTWLWHKLQLQSNMLHWVPNKYM